MPGAYRVQKRALDSLDRIGVTDGRKLPCGFRESELESSGVTRC